MATSATPGSLSRLIRSPATRMSGWPGMVRSWPHSDAARPVLLGAGGLGHRVGERRRLDARGPQDGAHLIPGGVAVVVLDLEHADGRRR